MQDERPEPCPQRELITAFAHGQLEDVRRREAELVLEQSEPCRELFRQLTAGRYPRLPNYTIIGQVGKGGFGVVYKAIHHAKERTEALKVLFSKTPLLTSYFENEVHLIARLRHPNIATLYDAQLSTPPLYYTMEFVEGERLNDYLKGHGASLTQRIDVIKTVAQAVGYAHTQGVVHRDLKPQNILVDDEGQPHVVDFGIAKKLALVEARPQEAEGASPESHEGPVGTLGYIAPEQEKGRPIDARADIFALGALLFHCVTGEPARLARVADQRIRILRERQVARPEDLAAIIGRCVEDSPDRRYGTCPDLVADLDNYVAGRSIAAREAPSLAYQAFRIAALVMRDRPWTVRAAALILVTAFLTWYFWAVEAFTFGGGGAGGRTVMIGITDETLRAIDEGRIGADLPELSSANHLSWRMLYGRLMERLAKAEPLVVVWDGYFEPCSEFDEDFVRGANALKAPVIVAACRFDINGEPELCETIGAAVDGCGTILGAEADRHPNAYEVAYCIQRGFETIPGLALAAFAAHRFPDCDPHLELESDRLLRLKYQRRNPEPGRRRWERDIDEFPLHKIVTPKTSKRAYLEGRADAEAYMDYLAAGWVEDNDEVAHVLVRARPNAYWQSEGRTIAFEDALTAREGQRKRWFKDRVIVIGNMRSPMDEHPRTSGEKIFGCQVQAEAIDELFAHRQHHRFGRGDLAIRNAVWCAAAVILVSVQGRRTWRSLRRVTLTCGLLFLTGVVVVGGGSAVYVSERWLLEALIAITGLLTAGSLAFWTKAVRERQLQLAPSAVTLASEEPTLASTVLAETH